MMITKYRDVRFTLVRLSEIDHDDLQVRIPLGIFINSKYLFYHPISETRLLCHSVFAK